VKFENRLADAEDNKRTDGFDTIITMRKLEADKNDGISCELGICYPILQSVVSGRKKNQLSDVSILV
jgi:hypothetical protein